jgi:serine/threonine-protein kinase HipA
VRPGRAEIDESNAHASLATALEVADLFRVSEVQAREIVREVSDATARWRDVARTMGLGDQRLERLEPAFEHEQSAAARDFTSASKAQAE